MKKERKVKIVLLIIFSSYKMIRFLYLFRVKVQSYYPHNLSIDK